MTDHDDVPPDGIDDTAAQVQEADLAVAPVEAAEQQLVDAEASLREQREKYLRLAAEFDNYRKRAARERETAEHHGVSVVIRGLIDALDDLARFAHLDAPKTDAATVIDGAAMVEQKLLKSLAGRGLEVINPLGHAFDPKVHEAVSTAPAASAQEDDTVAQVYQVGYVLNGQLLRPARVVVKQWNA